MKTANRMNELRLMLLIFTFIAGIWWAQAEWNGWRAVRTERLSEERKVAIAKTELEELKQFTKQYEALPEDVNKLRHIIPVAKEVAEILVQLESIANKNEMAFDSISLEDSAKTSSGAAGAAASTLPAGVTELPVKVALNGPYENFRNYIRDLEDNIRLIDVDSISMQNGQYSLAATVYYLKP